MSKLFIECKQLYTASNNKAVAPYTRECLRTELINKIQQYDLLDDINKNKSEVIEIDKIKKDVQSISSVNNKFSRDFSRNFMNKLNIKEL